MVKPPLRNPVYGVLGISVLILHIDVFYIQFSTPYYSCRLTSICIPRIFFAIRHSRHILQNTFYNITDNHFVTNKISASAYPKFRKTAIYRVNLECSNTKITISQNARFFLYRMLLICLQDNSAQVCCFVMYLLDIRQIADGCRHSTKLV